MGRSALLVARLVAAVGACVAVEFYATSLRISQKNRKSCSAGGQAGPGGGCMCCSGVLCN